MTDSTAVDGTNADGTETETTKRRFTFGRVMAGIAVTAWLSFWIWAFAIASPSNPNELDTVSYGVNSEAVCSVARSTINAMPSPRNAKTPQQRSDQMVESTRIVEDMVAALRTEADSLVDPQDSELVGRWLDDYDAYVADRWRYVDKLSSADGTESARDLAFTLSPRVSGGVYTTRIDTFARSNRMPSCQVPGDV